MNSRREGAVSPEVACELLIDADAIGQSWTRQDTPNTDFDSERRVAICGAVYVLFGGIRNPPSAGPIVVSENVYLSEHPIPADEVIDLAHLRAGSFDVAGATMTRTLELMAGPSVGEYSQWYRHTTATTLDAFVHRELGVIIGRGSAYARLSGFGPTDLEPIDLIGAAQAASERLER